MSVKYPETRQRPPIPHLDRIITQSGHDFRVVILEATDTFRVLGSTVDPLEVVLSATPIVLDGVNVFNDGGIESPVEGVVRVLFPGLGLKKELDPSPPLGQTPPKCVRVHFPLDQLLPQHPF